MDEPDKLLTIGGSDSGGAAGVQADLKTWTALAAYGMSALTAVTAQNSVTVTAVHALPPAFVTTQIDAVLDDYGAAAVKTGFIGRVELVVAVAQALRRHAVPVVVVDPVLVNHRGESMFPPEVAQAYREHLLPLATLLTPNRREAALLSDRPLPSPLTLAWLEETAVRLHALGPRHVLLKGGRLGSEMVDLLYDGRSLRHFRSEALDTPNTHGSGDTLAAAVCAFLARGETMETAVVQARAFTLAALRRARHWRLGAGHGPLAHFQQ